MREGNTLSLSRLKELLQRIEVVRVACWGTYAWMYTGILICAAVSCLEKRPITIYRWIGNGILPVQEEM